MKNSLHPNSLNDHRFSMSELNLERLNTCLQMPAPFEKGDISIWRDPHVARSMLALHLNPDTGAASRTAEQIIAEAQFIIQTAKLQKGKTVMDLGCGPGLYTRQFATTGATVHGLDFSDNSIAYAESVNPPPGHKAHIIYQVQDYLQWDIQEEFDLITLIFCDFSALSPLEQQQLLRNVRKALKPGGMFVFDVMSDQSQVGEDVAISVKEDGFWRASTHIEIHQRFLLASPYAEAHQYTIIDREGSITSFHVWHRLFTVQEISLLLEENGWIVQNLYADLTGVEHSTSDSVIAIVAKKPK